MDHKQRVSYLLNKYINNACTQEEFDELMSEIKTSADFIDFDDVMKKNWVKSASASSEHDVNWDGIYTNVKDKTRKRYKTGVVLKYAACFALIFAICTISIYKKPVVDTQYLTAHSLPAKTKVITLGDGTRVTLNANSDLRYPRDFNGAQRVVYLKGEAYFEVVHDAKKPFIIYSGTVRTQVLGTSFTVSAYNEQKPTKVTVLTGKVGVIDQSNKAEAMLTRGLCATTDHIHQNFTISRIADPEEAIAWLDDKLMFENTTLADVVTALSNKYAVTIKISNKRIAAQRITAIFQNQTLPDILKGITRLTHSKYRIDNNVYTLF
jgi:transmembrane sensor